MEIALLLVLILDAIIVGVILITCCLRHLRQNVLNHNRRRRSATPDDDDDDERQDLTYHALPRMTPSPSPSEQEEEDLDLSGYNADISECDDDSEDEGLGIYDIAIMSRRLVKMEEGRLYHLAYDGEDTDEEEEGEEWDFFFKNNGIIHAPCGCRGACNCPSDDKKESDFYWF